MTDFHGMSYEAMMAGSTYSIIRSHRDMDGTWDKLEASGLTLEAARAKEAELRAAERKAHPEKSGWTRDLFILQLEHGEEINKELQRQRMERSNAMQRS